jgi:hypothetical protein
MYTSITRTTAMTDVIVEIVVEVLTILAGDKGSEMWEIE